MLNTSSSMLIITRNKESLNGEFERAYRNSSEPNQSTLAIDNKKKKKNHAHVIFSRLQVIIIRKIIIII